MRYYIIVFHLVLGLISTVQAQTQTYTLINGIKVEAVAVSSARIASNGEVLQGIQFRAQSGTIPPKFFERAVQFNKGTTATSIKNFGKRNAFGLGLTAITLALGWSLDSITGDIYPALNNGSSPALSCNPSFSTTSSIAAQSCTISGINAEWKKNCDLWAKPNYGSASYCSAVAFSSAPSSATYTVWCSICNGYAGALLGPYTETIAQTGTYNQPAIPPSTSPATDTQIADNILPQIAPQNLPKLHTDPVTQAVQKTQEVLNKATDVANDYARELNPDSVNATAPTAAPLPVFQEKAATDTLPQPNASSTIFPDFCTWASFLCDAPIEPINSNWTVASMITEEEIELESYSSGLGSGSCPSPEAFTVYGTSISYSYQPMCDLAGVARIFVLIFAYLSSIYILLGIRK